MRGVAVSAAVGAFVGVAGRGAAQTPSAPPAPDSVRAATSDSTRRDSVIATQLRRTAGQATPVYRRFAPDQLRLTAVGASAGYALPDQSRGAMLYAVHADYGEIAPNVRVLFGVSYWTSRIRDDAVEALARAVGDAAGAPPGAPPVRLGRVRTSDVSLNADLRWRPGAFRGARLPLGIRPWVSGGGGVHLLDVQGAPITGTFVERALDGVSFGIAGALGADLTLLPTVHLTAQGRYDLFHGAHFASARAGASYVLERRGRP